MFKDNKSKKGKKDVSVEYLENIIFLLKDHIEISEKIYNLSGKQEHLFRVNEFKRQLKKYEEELNLERIKL